MEDQRNEPDEPRAQDEPDGQPIAAGFAPPPMKHRTRNLLLGIGLLVLIVVLFVLLAANG